MYFFELFQFHSTHLHERMKKIQSSFHTQQLSRMLEPLTVPTQQMFGIDKGKHVVQVKRKSIIKTSHIKKK